MLSLAVVFERPGEVAVRSVELPDPAPDDVLVRTEWSALSPGTEGRVLDDRFFSRSFAAQRFPTVPGYQRVGTIEALGGAVRDLRVGQRVFATRGRVSGGVAATWGGHVALALTPADEVMPLPDGIDGRVAAGLVLAQVGHNGATRPARTGPGALVVVVGDGLVGQYAAQASRARGAHVLLAGRRTDRLAAAARHSATEVLDVRAEDLAAAVRARRPDGADVVIDTSSTADGVRAATALLRRDGELVLLGWYPEGENLLDVFWFIAGKRELAAHFTGGWTRPRLEATLAAVGAGTLRVAELITHDIPWQDAAEAFALARDRASVHLGIVIDWRGSDTQ